MPSTFAVLLKQRLRYVQQGCSRMGTPDPSLPGTRRLELISAKPLRSGVVAMHYRRAR
jgi:hypothetical protein